MVRDRGPDDDLSHLVDEARRGMKHLRRQNGLTYLTTWYQGLKVRLKALTNPEELVAEAREKYKNSVRDEIKEAIVTKGTDCPYRKVSNPGAIVFCSVPQSSKGYCNHNTNEMLEVLVEGHEEIKKTQMQSKTGKTLVDWYGNLHSEKMPRCDYIPPKVDLIREHKKQSDNLN